jgi:hypothetical protein
MKEIAMIQAATQKRHAIQAVTRNWNAASYEEVRLSLLLMETGLEMTTDDRGREWIQKNLGGKKTPPGLDNPLTSANPNNRTFTNLRLADPRL